MPNETFAITNVQVFPIREPKGKLLGFARVQLGEQLQLTGLKVLQGGMGLIVSYPSDGADDIRQIFYPVTRELKDAIEKAVLEEYKVAMET